MDLISVILDVVVKRLFHCIETGNVEFQPRLLTIIKSLFTCVSSNKFTDVKGDVKRLGLKRDVTIEIAKPGASFSPKSQGSPVRTVENEQHLLSAQQRYHDIVLFETNSTTLIDHTPEPIIEKTSLFVKVISDALFTPTNSILLNTWVDFIIGQLYIIKYSFYDILFPILKCIVYQLGIRRDSIKKNVKVKIDVKSSIEDDMVVLIYALDKLFSFCFGMNDFKSDSTSVKLSAFLSTTVLNSRLIVNDGFKIKESLFDLLPDILCILGNIVDGLNTNIIDTKASDLLSFDSFISFMNSRESRNSTTGIGKIKKRVSFRVKKFLDNIYSHYPLDLVESLVYSWNNDKKSIQLIEMISDFSKTSVFNYVIDSLKVKIPLLGRHKPQTHLTLLVVESNLFQFLEYYIASLSSAALIEIWPQLLSYIRDLFTQTTYARHLYPKLLLLLVEYLNSVSKEDFINDKKFRKDFEDIFIKLYENTILLFSRPELGRLQNDLSTNLESSPAPSPVRMKGDDTALQKVFIT